MVPKYEIYYTKTVQKYNKGLISKVKRGGLFDDGKC